VGTSISLGIGEKLGGQRGSCMLRDFNLLCLFFFNKFRSAFGWCFFLPSVFFKGLLLIFLLLCAV
jgi:hypothetical protein